MLKGGWWWKSCGRGLNGIYLNDPQDLTARQGIRQNICCIYNFFFNWILIITLKYVVGIVWFRWRGWDYTLKKAVMMIKPRGSVSNSAVWVSVMDFTQRIKDI